MVRIAHPTDIAIPECQDFTTHQRFLSDQVFVTGRLRQLTVLIAIVSSQPYINIKDPGTNQQRHCFAAGIKKPAARYSDGGFWVLPDVISWRAV